MKLHTRTAKRAIVRTRLGTRAESLKLRHLVAAREQADLELPDGSAHAVRVQFNRDTGEPIRDKDGTVRICCPWLLCDLFNF